MGMDHFAFSRKHRVNVYLLKTREVQLSSIPRLTYYNNFIIKNPYEWVRSGVLLQSILRERGKVDRCKPFVYNYANSKRFKRTINFFGQTYVDKTCIGILEEFELFDDTLSRMLLGLLSRYPGRWIFYSPDMCEPILKTNVVREATFVGGSNLYRIDRKFL